MFHFKCRLYSLVLIILLIITQAEIVKAQIEKPGLPMSGSLSLQVDPVKFINILPPDSDLLKAQDNQSSSIGDPYRIGVSVPVDNDFFEEGEWFDLADGSKLWVLVLKCMGARAVGIDFDRFILPPDAEMYLSSMDYSMIAGAFTSSNQNDDHAFSIRPVAGDQVRLEIHLRESQPSDVQMHISALNYIYRGFFRNGASVTDYGSAGTCQVNLACDEGTGWADQSNGVVKILIRIGSNSFWCSGSVINNMNYDFAPLVITANHCTIYKGYMATAKDLLKWVFYFNYQTPGCENPLYEPIARTMTGAVRLASSQQPDEIGSDFYLLRINQQIPESYHAFYNGWSRDENPAESGICIHHPMGDVKKISSYKTRLESGKVQSIPNTHWIADWIPTKNGHGVMEPGSSGSPLFNENGLIVGTCTGGYSSCDNTDGTDYFGKISFSWASNGNADTIQLSAWLDPAGAGRTTLEGGYNNLDVITDFSADKTVIPVGGNVNFSDLSVREPVSWYWIFEGAEPQTSDLKNPGNIRYNSCGKFNVTCIATNSKSSDTLIRKAYIEVKSILYPNPTSGRVTIFTNGSFDTSVLVNVFDGHGKFVTRYEWPDGAGPSVSMDLPDAGNLFFLQFIQGDLVQVHKVIVLR